jgi:hypothetical protein
MPRVGPHDLVSGVQGECGEQLYLYWLFTTFFLYPWHKIHHPEYSSVLTLFMLTLFLPTYKRGDREEGRWKYWSTWGRH